MKKKIYFITVAILEIIVSIYFIINSNQIIQAQLESIEEAYAMFPADFQQRVTNMYQNNGAAFINVLSIIAIVLNAILIKVAFNGTILKNKGKLIAIFILCLLLSESSIIAVLSILNIFVLLCLKRKNPEDFPSKEKKEIPHLEYQRASKKELILSIILVVVYFSQFLVNHLLPEDINLIIGIVIVVVYYAILLFLSIYCFKDKLKRDIKLFKENAKAYFQFVLPKLGIMYIIFICSSLICILITKQATSVNQSMLEEMPKWFLFPIAIIWAPIVEELIFRGVIRRFLKNDTAFIFVSAIIFGLLHTISEVPVLNTFVLAIPYGILGGFLAYLYAKTDNLSNNILAHSFNNLIAVILTSFAAYIIL